MHDHVDLQDHEAARLVRKYGPMVAALIRRYLPRGFWSRDLDDLFQEAWRRYFEEFPAGTEEPRTPRAWFATVVLRLVRDHARRERVRDRLAEQLLLDGRTRQEGWAGLFDGMLKALRAELSKEHWGLLRAFYLEGKTAEDIARRNGTSVAAVSQRLYRVRLHVRKKYPTEEALLSRALDESLFSDH